MVKQQRNNFTMAQVSVDTQQGGIAEGISAVIHISTTHNQQPAYLDTERSELQSICDKVFSDACVQYVTLMLGV